MLVGLSILFASFSLFVYRFPPSKWRALLSHLLKESATRSPAAPEDSSRPSSKSPRNDPRRNLAVSHKDEHQDFSRSPETTPKAEPAVREDAVPSFSLSPAGQDDDDGAMPPPSFPAPNSIQRASSSSARSSGMNPPPPPSLAAPSRPAPTQMMPPPPRPPTSGQARMSLAPSLPAANLRIPSTGPLPNRGPATNLSAVAANSTLGLPPSAAGRLQPNARKKVELAAGCSPLDWARLQRSGENLAGVPSLQRVKPSELKQKNGRRGKPAWSAYQGKVYNITPYLPFHPGGVGELMRAAGKDGEKLFIDIHPWVNWENMLGECLVGILVGENDDAMPGRGSELDEMD